MSNILISVFSKYNRLKLHFNRVDALVADYLL